MNSIEQCIVERASHEQELQNGLKKLNERKLQIQKFKVQKVKASDVSSGHKDCSTIVSDKGNDQSLENQSNTSGDESRKSRNECNDKSSSGDDTNIRPSNETEPMVEVPYTVEYNVFVVDTQHSEKPERIINTCVVEKVDSNVIFDSPDMCDNDIQTEQNAKDERAALANLIANLKLDVDENKRIQNQLKKANTSLKKHSISLKLDLQQGQEQMKNDTVCKEKASSVFLKEREQYFEIQDLKAQLQDKNIAISELKKLIEKMKEPPRNQKTFLKSKDLAYPTCKKCIYSANHDDCILKYLSKVGLKWIPIRKSIETRYNTNDSASPTICANSSSFSAGTSMAFEPIFSKGSSN
nr:hypothetical protein [Tanacetum cinerariifolium]